MPFALPLGFVEACVGLIRRESPVIRNHRALHCWFTGIYLSLFVFIMDDLSGSSMPTQVLPFIASGLVLSVQLVKHWGGDVGFSIFSRMFLNTIYLVGLFWLEVGVKMHSQFLLPFVALTAVHDLVTGEPSIEVLAVCIAYASMYKSWYTEVHFVQSRLLIFSYLAIGILFSFMIKRIMERIVNLLQVQSILKSKTINEATLTKAYLSAHVPLGLISELQKGRNSKGGAVKHPASTSGLPNDLIDTEEHKEDAVVVTKSTNSANSLWTSLFSKYVKLSEWHSSSGGVSQSHSHELGWHGQFQSHSESSGWHGSSGAQLSQVESSIYRSLSEEILNHAGITGGHVPSIDVDPLAQNALSKGMLAKYEHPKISLDRIGMLAGVDRRPSAVIVIKYCGGANDECAIVQSSWHLFMELLDEMGQQKLITCVRKNGDTWVGCLGFFRSWSKSGWDCLCAIEMACAAVTLGVTHNMRVCCAVDYGSIVGGFVNERTSFDIIGQEVRWVLCMVEQKLPNQIYVSVAAKTHAQTRQQGHPPAVPIKFHKPNINPPLISSVAKCLVYVVANPMDVGEEKLKPILSSPIPLSKPFAEISMSRKSQLVLNGMNAEGILIDRHPSVPASNWIKVDLERQKQLEHRFQQQEKIWLADRSTDTASHMDSCIMEEDNLDTSACVNSSTQMCTNPVQIVKGFSSTLRKRMGTKFTELLNSIRNTVIISDIGEEFLPENICAFNRFGITNKDVECYLYCDDINISSNICDNVVPLQQNTATNAAAILLAPVDNVYSTDDSVALETSQFASFYQDDVNVNSNTLMQFEEAMGHMRCLVDELCFDFTYNYILLQSPHIPSFGSFDIPMDESTAIHRGTDATSAGKLFKMYSHNPQYLFPLYVPNEWSEWLCKEHLTAEDRGNPGTQNVVNNSSISSPHEILLDNNILEPQSEPVESNSVDQVTFNVWKKRFSWHNLARALSNVFDEQTYAVCMEDVALEDEVDQLNIGYLDNFPLLLSVYKMSIYIAKVCILGFVENSTAYRVESAPVEIADESSTMDVQGPSVYYGGTDMFAVNTKLISSSETGITRSTGAAQHGAAAVNPSFISSSKLNSNFVPPTYGDANESKIERKLVPNPFLDYVHKKAAPVAVHISSNDSDLKRFSMIHAILSGPVVLLRGWKKYLSDVGSISHSNLVHVCVWVWVIAVSWFALQLQSNVYPSSANFVSHNGMMVSMYYITILASFLVDKNYVFRNIYFSLVVVRTLLFGSISLGNCNVGFDEILDYVPVNYGQTATTNITAISNSTEIGGYVAGEVIRHYGGGKLLLLLVAWIPLALNSPMLHNAVQLICIWAMLFVKLLVFSPPYCTPGDGVVTLIGFLLLLMQLYGGIWLIQYYGLISYFLEHKLVPAAYKVYSLQKEGAQLVVSHCVNAKPPPLGTRRDKDILRPKRYTSCDVIAIHVKPSDILPGLVPSADYTRFLSQIYKLIDGCVEEYGLVKVSQFAGTYIAVNCHDHSAGLVHGVHCAGIGTTGSSLVQGLEISNSVVVIRGIRQRLESMNRTSGIHVSFGMGVCQGSLSVGLLGQGQYCFDCTGRARDLAYAMAVQEADGVLITEAIAARIKNNANNFNDHTRMFRGSETIPSTSSTALRWLGSATVPVTCGKTVYNCHRLVFDNGADGMNLDDFKHIGMLGKGGYGSVHLAREARTGEEFAIKVLPRGSHHSSAELIRNEFLVLQNMDHPNVVKFKCCIMNASRIYLVMYYIKGGTLKQIVDKLHPDMSILILWFAELVLALEYVHDRGIIHRDVKASNCMIDTDGHLQLADFGLSKIIENNKVVPIKDESNIFYEENGVHSRISDYSIQVMRKVFPTKLKAVDATSDGTTNELGISVLLIDSVSHSAVETQKVLNQMYFDVMHAASVEDVSEIKSMLANGARGDALDLILFDIGLSELSIKLSKKVGEKEKKKQTHGSRC